MEDHIPLVDQFSFGVIISAKQNDLKVAQLRCVLGSICHGQAGYGLALCLPTDRGSQIFNSLLNFLRDTKLQVYTSSRFAQNPLYSQFLINFIYRSKIVSSYDGALPR